MLHASIAAHDDRPAGPRGAPAGRGVLASLLFASHLSALSTNRLSIGLALGAFEGPSGARALSASVDAALCSVAARDTLLILASRD